MRLFCPLWLFILWLNMDKTLQQNGCPKAVVPNGFVVSFKGRVYYSCNENYKLFNKGWWGEAKCTDKLWTGLERCIDKRHCGKIPVIPNGRVSDRAQSFHRHGQSVQIVCKDGYRAHLEQLTCSEGKWNSNELQLQNICTPSDDSCNPPPRVANAVVLTPYQKKYAPDSEVIYRCRDTYATEGGDALHCKNGDWDNSIKCIQYCGQFKEERQAMTFISNKDRYNPGERIHYQCTTKNDNGIATCIDGQWNKSVECEDITCKMEVMHPHLYVAGLPPSSGPIQTGHKLKFQCDSRYTLVGSVETECLETGQWSHPFPTCGSALGCRRHPPPLEDGDTKESGRIPYSHNERVEYVCQPFYTMEGDPFKTCTNGEWTGQMRCIRPCTVDKEAMSQRHIGFRYSRDDKLYSAHDDEIEFRCTPNWRRPVSGVAMRQKCLNGVMNLPSCQ